MAAEAGLSQLYGLIGALHGDINCSGPYRFYKQWRQKENGAGKGVAHQSVGISAVGLRLP